MDLAITLLLTISGIIILGFIADLIFRKTGIPHVIVLFAIGFMLGPSGFGYVDFTGYGEINIFIGLLALIFLLFEGAMELDIFDVIHKSGRALLMAVLEVLLSIVACSLLFQYAFGFNPWVGATFGAIAGGTASQIVIPIARKMGLGGAAKQFFTLESSATDALCIVSAMVILTSLLSTGFDMQGAGKMLMSSVSIGAVLGFAMGIATIVMVSKIRTDYPYMLIMAVLILAYVVAEYFGGSGVIAVMLYGIAMGNRKKIGEMLKYGEFKDDESLRRFQSEISFFIGTFFFIYMGTMVKMASMWVVTMALVAIVALFMARLIAAYISTWGSRLIIYRNLIVAMQSRGVAMAVLALIPSIAFAKELAAPGMGNIAWEFSLFPGIAMIFIVVSIVLNSIGVALLRNGVANAEKAMAEAEAKEQAAQGKKGAPEKR